MALIKWPTLQNPLYFSKIRMNILPRNPADREAKSPCDKNIRYTVSCDVCSRTWFTKWDYYFLTIVVYDKQKTTLVDDPIDLINTRRLSPVSGLSGPETIYSCDQVTWIKYSVSGHLDHVQCVAQLVQGYCSATYWDTWRTFIWPIYAVMLLSH
jgi:hypothetical protein